MPQHAAKIRPPRTLNVPFEFGRPLGVPHDPAFQHRVLSAALKLLEHNDGPVVESYAEEAPIRNNEEIEGWSCPVNFASRSKDETVEQQLTNEIGLLQPWFDKGKEKRGYTSFGVSGMPLESIVNFIGSFLKKESTTIPSGEYSVADTLKYAAEDLKAFYNESATSQPGNVTANEVENWYWGETAAGRLIREIKKTCADHEDQMVKIVAGFTLVPHSQAFRDSE